MDETVAEEGSRDAPAMEDWGQLISFDPGACSGRRASTS